MLRAPFMKMTLLLFIIVSITPSVMLGGSKWMVEIDNKPNAVTGFRNVLISKGPDKGSLPRLVIGCKDNRPVLWIFQNFQIANDINDGLLKSELERAVQPKGPQSESHGFVLRVVDGKVRSSVKIRFDGDTEYFDSEVAARYGNGTYVLDLDWQLFGPKIKEGAKMLVEVPYKGGPQVKTFSFDGLDAVSKQAAAAG